MNRDYDQLTVKLKRLMTKRLSAAERLLASKERYEDAKGRFEKEKSDVDKLERESLSVFLRNVIGTYEKKLDKEKQEQVAAKIELDRTAALYLEAQENLSSIDDELLKTKSQMDMLREALLENDSSFQKEMAQEHLLRTQREQEVIELDEAIQAGERVLNRIDGALEQLGSAGSLATWDLFTDSSFLMDMVKYSKIDRAEEEIHHLERALETYRKELKDVSLEAVLDYEEHSSMRRTFDIFFDNIFSDWSTRDTIKRNTQMLNQIGMEVENIQVELHERKKVLQQQIQESRELY